MTNDILNIISVTSDKVICSVNVNDPLQVAENPAYGPNDAYIAIDREYEGGACWDGLRVTFVKKDGSSSTVRNHSLYGTRGELVRSVVRDVETLMRKRGLSLYGMSMKPYKKAQVSAVYGDRWWGTLYDEYGRELNVRCVGRQSKDSLDTAFTRMLEEFNIPYFGSAYVSRYDAYSGPKPSTNCTYYMYEVDEALDGWLESGETTDEEE